MFQNTWIFQAKAFLKCEGYSMILLVISNVFLLIKLLNFHAQYVRSYVKQNNVYKCAKIVSLISGLNWVVAIGCRASPKTCKMSGVNCIALSTIS